MSKLTNSVFLVSGTAVGSGLISLPISAAKLGLKWTVVITMIAFWVAYKMSCLTIALMKKQGRALSIVELSSEISGKYAKLISMTSLYALSLALLCAYFAGTTSIFARFFGLSFTLSTLICIVVFSVLLTIRSSIFNRINSSLVFILFGLIATAVYAMPTNKLEFTNSLTHSDYAAIMSFLPIIFTSFGVQNVCPYVAQNMGLGDIKAIRKVFFIGTLIPAIVYLLWICATLSRLYIFDHELYVKILTDTVDVGDFVKSLCSSAQLKYEAIILQLLSLFAIMTSATGTGIGLISSLKEITVCRSKLVIATIVIGIPTMMTLLIPNAFIRILSFGGMIATTFVVFVPVFLQTKIGKVDISHIFCFIFGILVVVAELFM